MTTESLLIMLFVWCFLWLVIAALGLATINYPTIQKILMAAAFTVMGLFAITVGLLVVSL